jgi:lipoprotein-releasing system permease protein
VAWCFCFQGLIIGIVGAALGLAIAFVFLAYRNDLLNFLNKAVMSRESYEKFYQFSSLPAYTQTGEVVAVVAFALVVSLLAALLPAWRSGSMHPVDALRSE